MTSKLNIEITQHEADLEGVAKMMAEQIESQRATFADTEFTMGDKSIRVAAHDIFVNAEKLDLPIPPTVENFSALQAAYALILEISFRQPDAQKF